MYVQRDALLTKNRRASDLIKCTTLFITRVLLFITLYKHVCSQSVTV